MLSFSRFACPFGVSVYKYIYSASFSAFASFCYCRYLCVFFLLYCQLIFMFSASPDMTLCICSRCVCVCVCQSMHEIQCDDVNDLIDLRSNVYVQFIAFNSPDVNETTVVFFAAWLDHQLWRIEQTQLPAKYRYSWHLASIGLCQLNVCARVCGMAYVFIMLVCTWCKC